MRYVHSREASRILGAHPQTLRAWAREGRIDYIRTEGNQRRYDVDSYIGNSKPTITVRYCCVSSKKQSADLERQVAIMRARYPDTQIISDVGSGLNFKRNRFRMFLRQKASEHGVTVLSVNEAYTTKTVSWTGEVLEDVGGASVITGSDGERMGRDYNGARGIYLRALGDWLLACAASADYSCLSGNVRAVA